MSRYCDKYGSLAESEELMLDRLQSILTDHAIGQDLAQAVMLTVSEAFTNALLHGNCLDPKKSITVEIEIETTQLKVVVTDEGKGATEFWHGRTIADPMAESGRGVGLMKYYSHLVEFSRTLSGGLKVSVFFDRRREYKASLHS